MSEELDAKRDFRITRPTADPEEPFIAPLGQVRQHLGMSNGRCRQPSVADGILERSSFGKNLLTRLEKIKNRTTAEE